MTEDKDEDKEDDEESASEGEEKEEEPFAKTLGKSILYMIFGLGLVALFRYAFSTNIDVVAHTLPAILWWMF